MEYNIKHILYIDSTHNIKIIRGQKDPKRTLTWKTFFHNFANGELRDLHNICHRFWLANIEVILLIIETLFILWLIWLRYKQNFVINLFFMDEVYCIWSFVYVKKWYLPERSLSLIIFIKFWPYCNLLVCISKIEKVWRGMQGEKSSKDTTSSRNLVSTIGPQTSPKKGDGTRCAGMMCIASL